MKTVAARFNLVTIRKSNQYATWYVCQTLGTEIRKVLITAESNRNTVHLV